jgi:hypothetical protein
MNTNETAVKVVSYLFGLPQKTCGNCPFKNDKADSYLCELKGKGEGRLPFEWKIYPR